MKKKFILYIILNCICFISFSEPKPIDLWKDNAEMKHYPSKLYVYEAPDSLRKGIAVIVCPGGSYSHLMGIKIEGFEVAEWLNTQGIDAFVLKYRRGSQAYHFPAMFEDVQYAIKLVKENHGLYSKTDSIIGAMGFSAGGHLVTMCGAFYGNKNLKPDFIVPIYPVVSMQDSIAHKRSRRNLLGSYRSKIRKDHFSMELNIPDDMPPVFLVTAKDDPVVKYQNSVVLNQALNKKNIEHEFHLYETGGHGYGCSETIAPEASAWKYAFINWLKKINLIKNN